MQRLPMLSDGHPTRVPVRSPQLVTRAIVDETVLLPVRRGAVEMDVLYVLNATAAFIWERMDGRRTDRELIDLLQDQFAIDRSTAEADVREFLDGLERAGLASRAA